MVSSVLIIFMVISIYWRLPFFFFLVCLIFYQLDLWFTLVFLFLFYIEFCIHKQLEERASIL